MQHRTFGHVLMVNGLRVGALAMAVGWWLYSNGPGDVSRLILPDVGDVIRAFFGFLTDGEVYEALRITITEIFVALLLASVAGFAVGFWGARSDVRVGVLEPLLVWGYLIPTILFYPLFILWFGIGTSSKIAYAAQAAFFPIAFNSLRGFRGVDHRYINVGRAFGASPAQLDWIIKLRAGLPVAAAGLRLGAALCMITVIVAEMLASQGGLGYLLTFYAASFSTAKTFALIGVLLLVVGVFHAIVNRLLPEDRSTR